MKRTFIIYTDPGHGWLKCSKTELIKSGTADKITPFSYMDEHHVYLEEDRDTAVFLQTFLDKGIEIKIKARHTNQDSPIRNYLNYRY